VNPYMIMRKDGKVYKHDYPCGKWVDFPFGQLYKGRSAASRQANKLPGAFGVRVVIDLVREDFKYVD
jgi:hypothetical protein